MYTRMKGIAVHGDDILDTVEYARPPEVGQLEKQIHVEMFLKNYQCLFSAVINVLRSDFGIFFI